MYIDTVLQMRAMGVKWGFDGAGMYTHSGMLHAADTVLLEIEKLGILKRLMMTKSSVTNEVVSFYIVNIRMNESVIDRYSYFYPFCLLIFYSLSVSRNW